MLFQMLCLVLVIDYVLSQCLSTQYDDGSGNCLDCLTICATCLDGLSCDTCQIGNFLDSGQCSSCDPSCQGCQGTAIYCTSCDSTKELFLDSITNTCASCDSPKFRENGVCVDSCTNYQQVGNNNCQDQCDSNCNTCTIYDTQCVTCSIGNFLNLNNNMCQLTCDSNCQTCDTTTTNCLTCPTQYFLDNITQLNGICIICNTPCAECQSPSATEICVDCQAYYYLDGSQICQHCDPSCYKCTGILNTQCSQCNDGKYLSTSGSDKTCQNCQSPCGNCSDINVCITCIDGFLINGTNCDPCTKPCFTCMTNATNCLSCNDLDNRTLNNNQCICKSHYYDQNNGLMECLVCDTNCKDCIDNATKCTSCQNRWYLDNEICYVCSQNCLTCETTANNCLTCDEITNLRQWNNYQCVCEDGKYYSDTQQICIICVEPCQTCESGLSSDGNQCLSCVPNYNRTVNNKVCVCSVGYYDSGFLTCQPCANYCVSCLSNETDCDVCQPNTNRDASKHCDCLDGYYANGISCALCKSPCYNCVTVNTKCLTCVNGLNRIINNTTYTCDCQNGYYETSSKVCSLCNLPCATCKTTPNTCYTCIAKYYQPIGQLKCLSCVSPCEECAPSDGNKCISCLPIQNREVSNNLCVCKLTYYKMDDINPCISCILPCYKCEDFGDGTQCTQCNIVDNRIVDTNKTCVCNVNYYSQLNSFICLPCIAPCLECLDDTLILPATGNQCVTCQPNYNRIIDNTNNLCPCQDGYYETTNILLCTQCIAPCLECEDNGTGNECITCIIGSHRIVDNKLCICQDGYYQINTQIICGQCNYTCQTCQNQDTECHQCDALKHRILINNTCLCMDNYYDNQNNDQDCKQCLSPCQQCYTNNDGTKCKTCLPLLNRHLFGYQCICDNGYFENNSICQLCHPTCLTCNQIYSCLTCDVTKYLAISFNSQYACICQQGYSMNQLSQCVYTCPYDCLTCDTNDQCLTCYDNNAPINGRCKCNLIDNTYYCRNDCQDLDFSKLVTLINSSNNPLNIMITNAITPLSIFMDSTIDTFITVNTHKQGSISTNHYNNLIFFQQQQIIIDQQPFGLYASYYHFLQENKIRQLIFQKDNTQLDLTLSYQFQTSIYSQLNTVTNSNLKQTIITLDINHTYTVILIFTYNEDPTLSYQIINGVFYLTVSFSTTKQTIQMNEFYVDNTVYSIVTNTQLLNVANYIGLLYNQVFQYECQPHLKNMKQVFRENHQYLLDVIPNNLVPLKVSDGNNYILPAFSSGKFTGNGAQIQLNSQNINYQSSLLQYDGSGYTYLTIQYPDILVFALQMRQQFTFTSFTIQHNIQSGYSTNQPSKLEYNTKIGKFIGYWVDCYQTTSIKTLIFAFDQGHSVITLTNPTNIIITISGVNVKQFYFVVMAFADTVSLATYTNIFYQFVDLLLQSIYQCQGIPLRLFNQYLKLKPITGTFEQLTETIKGYKIQTGTNQYNAQYPFKNTHKISTNYQNNIVFTNGYIKSSDSSFGQQTHYFTSIDKLFVLGADLNNVQYLSISLGSDDSFIACTQQLIRYQYYQVIISQCQWSQFKIYQLFMFDFTQMSASITLVQSATQVKLNGITNLKQLFYVMTVTKNSDTLNTQNIIKQVAQIALRSKGYFGCDFQCLTLTTDFQCATYRTNYKTAMTAEFDSTQKLLSDIYNINGKKCEIFNFQNAVTVLQSQKTALDTLISQLIPNNVQPTRQDSYYQYDAYKIGYITSSAQIGFVINVPQAAANEVTQVTPDFFGAQSQIYEYNLNMLSVTLIETKIDRILINNKLNTDDKGQFSNSLQYQDDYGIVFQQVCFTTYDSLIFPNIYECFLRPLNSNNDDITITIVPPLKELVYQINQQDNIMMLYIVFADFGETPSDISIVNFIPKYVYQQLLNAVNEQSCKCWGRYKQRQNNCRCQDGYYPPNESVFGLLDCMPCYYKCQTCQFSDNQCISCPINSNRLLDLSFYTCECNDGYFETGVVLCSTCHYSCGKCDTIATKCTACKSGSHRTIDNILNKCNCDDGYYDDGTNQTCAKCHHSCSKCSSGGIYCISCALSAFRTQQADNSCTCDVGYYDDGTNSICQVCDYTCKSCVDSAQKCTDCKLNSHRNLVLANNQCVCDTHYYPVINQWDCQQCSQYCNNCTGSLNTECSDCLGLNRILIGTTCLCQDGYFKDALNSAICPQCDYQCQTCSVQSNQCLSCDLTQRIYDSFNKKCNCKDGFYDNGISSCQLCSYKCKTCVDNANKCLSCPLNTNRKYDSTTNTCKCQSSFSDIGVPICMKCDASCQECQTIPTYCIVCNTNKTFRLDKSLINNTCPCQDGYYDQQNMVCKICHPQCNTCQQYSICTSCNTTYGRIDKSLINQTCPCNDGYYDDNINKQCQQCNYACLTCTEKSTKCLTCNTINTQRYYTNNSCQCNDGYFDNNVLQCQQCNIKCNTCKQTNTSCLTCPSTRQGSSCECKIGYIESNVKECVQCYFKCGLCILTNLNTCLACNLYRINPPSCDCDSGYYELNNECLQCPNKCIMCDSTATCYNCKGDRLNNPLCNCPDGYYEDNVSINCTICYGNCATCDIDKCYTCLGNRILETKQCSCPANSVSHTQTPYCSNCDVAVLTIQFSQDLSLLLFTFPYNVQFPSFKKVTYTQACQLIFDQSTLETLGSAPSCSITQGNILQVELSEISTITIKTQIVFKTDFLTKTGCGSAISQFLITSFKYDSIQAEPSFELTTYSDQITLCQDIEINILNKYGDGKRSLSSIIWSVVSMNPSIQTVASALSQLLADANSKNLQSITIPALTLSESGSYIIQLKASNFRAQVFTAQTKIETASYEAPIISLDKNQQYIFGRWEDLAFTISLKHVSCYSNSVIEVFDALRVNWTQVSKTPNDTVNILDTSNLVETDGMTFLNTLRIPAYTAQIGSTYILQVTVSLTNKPIKTSLQFTIQIVSSPMQAYIQGGTRTQSYNDIALLNGFCRDPDFNYPWNQDPDITFEWSCINLATSDKCTDSNKEYLILNITDTFQTFKARVLDPYQPLQFIMKNKKNNTLLTTQVIILVIENDLPNIQVNYPSGYDSREILLHEELNFTLETSVDPDDLKYFCQILYDYNVVASFTFKFLQVKFRIWDYWEDVNSTINQVQIKMAAKDVYHFMPSTASVTLQINIPPLQCKLAITPSSGTSITDLFVISITNCQDTQLPLQYQFHIYSIELLNQDNIVGETINKKSITDKQSQSILQTVLPTPVNLDGSIAQELVLMVSIYDNNFGLRNVTKTIKINSILQKVESADFQSILLQIRRALKLSDTMTDSQLPSLFIGSQELSTLYMQLSQDKKLLMKSILKDIYTILQSFQGKMTSKVLEESLLSSIAAIGRTGINYEIDGSEVLDFYTIKQQIKKTTKQLSRQINDLDYCLQQKSKSSGSTSKYEDSIKALDNTLLNSGYVTDTLFNVLKGNEFTGSDVSDDDVNILKQQIQEINRLVALATLKRSLANEKPRQYAGVQMGMQAYKSTPAEITKILSNSIVPSFFGDSTTTTPSDLNGTGSASDNLNLNEEEDEINYDEYLLNNTNKTNANGNRLLQFIDWKQNKNNLNYRRNLQNLDPTTVKQYEVSMQNYKTSPNLQDSKFQQQLSTNQTTSVSNGTNVTHDTSVISNFGTIQPNITMTADGNSTEIKSLDGQTIKLSFSAPSDLAENSTMECFSEAKDKWGTGTCAISKDVDSSGNIAYVCDCSVVNPTTVITKLDSLIQNKLDTVFNADSLNIFLQIEFWKYAIFYIAIGFTGVYVALMVLGLRRDNQDFIEEITKELDVTDGPISKKAEKIKEEIHKLIKINEEDVEESVNEDPKRIKPEDMHKLALHTLKQNQEQEIKYDKEGNVIVPEDPNDEQDLEQLQNHQIQMNMKQLDFQKVQDELRVHELYNPKNQKKMEAKSLNKVIKNVYTVYDLQYEHGQEIKLKPLTLKVLWEGIMTLHRVLSILMLYDDVISRPARFALVYAKTILVLALSALFSGNMGPIYGVLISVGIGQVINVILTIITASMKASPILKFFGIVFTFSVSAVCWFIILMLSASMEEYQANMWAVQFASTQVTDLIVVEFITIAIKLSIYPWAIKALHEPDQSPSKILANLVFIVVAQPQISKFFEVEDQKKQNLEA